jgi:Carboxypeptidase regulatory-like domain
MSMRLNVLVLALFATSTCDGVCPLKPTATKETWRLSGTVSAMDGGQVGGPIAGATLTVASGVKTDSNATTDVQGRYAFPGLESGRLTLTISAPGYVSNTPSVDLYRDTEVNFVLSRQ